MYMLLMSFRIECEEAGVCAPGVQLSWQTVVCILNAERDVLMFLFFFFRYGLLHV